MNVAYSKFHLFFSNYLCSPAAIGFPVAKATSFHACGTALQKYEGNLFTSQLIFFVFVLDAYSAIFKVMQMFLAQLSVMLLEFQTFVVFFIDAPVVGHDRSSTAPQTCQRTGRHDHCCKVWPTCWHHQGYKYIFYILVITACPMVARIGSRTPTTLNWGWMGNTQDDLEQGCQIQFQ